MLRPAPTILVAVAALCFAGGASGQPVYKCKAKGTVVCSHEPCLGAEVVDTTPTEGLDNSGGTSRKGADVRRTEQSKQMAEALRPILGETSEQYEKRHRRSKLVPQERLECAMLDERLAKQPATKDAGTSKSFREPIPRHCSRLGSSFESFAANAG